MVISLIRNIMEKSTLIACFSLIIIGYISSTVADDDKNRRQNRLLLDTADKPVNRPIPGEQDRNKSDSKSKNDDSAALDSDYNSDYDVDETKDDHDKQLVSKKYFEREQGIKGDDGLGVSVASEEEGSSIGKVTESVERQKDDDFDSDFDSDLDSDFGSEEDESQINDSKSSFERANGLRVQDLNINEESASVAEEASASEPVSVAEEASANEAVSVAEEAFVHEKASVIEGASVAEESSVAEGASVHERASVAEEASVHQGASVAEEDSVTEGASVAEGASTSAAFSASEVSQAINPVRASERGDAQREDSSLSTESLAASAAGSEKDNVLNTVSESNSKQSNQDLLGDEASSLSTPKDDEPVKLRSRKRRTRNSLPSNPTKFTVALDELETQSSTTPRSSTSAPAPSSSKDDLLGYAGEYLDSHDSDEADDCIVEAVENCRRRLQFHENLTEKKCNSVQDKAPAERVDCLEECIYERNRQCQKLFGCCIERALIQCYDY